MTDRRHFLRGLATLPLVGGSVAASTVGVDPIFALIAKHKAAQRKLEAFLDMPETDREEAVEYALLDTETEARYDMHEVAPTTWAGLKAYVAYWNECCRADDTLQEVGWEAIATIAEALERLPLSAAGVPIG